MKVTYYPGCSHQGTAREFGESSREICSLLDIDLVDLPDWNCCGANAAASVDEDLGVDLVTRNLRLAQNEASPLVVPCAGCFNRLRWGQHIVGLHPEKAAEYAKGDPVDLMFLLDLFVQKDVLDRIRARVKKPLAGLRLAAYYGCVIARPPWGVAEADENLSDMETLTEALGAEPIEWPLKTQCCGSDLGLARPDILKTMAARLLDMAAQAGANALIVACPLCQANLDLRQDEIVAEGVGKAKMPVFYFTELIGLALGSPESSRWLGRHQMNPAPLLAELKLLSE